MTATSSDRMVVNAAIERLLTGGDENWLESARTVISFGVQIPSSGDKNLHSAYSQETKKGEAISGYAAGHGTVSADTGETKTTERQWGVLIERVGYYKLFHRKERGYIVFVPYRNMSPIAYVTQSLKQFALWYDIKTQEPTALYEVLYGPVPLSAWNHICVAAQTLYQTLKDWGDMAATFILTGRRRRIVRTRLLIRAAPVAVHILYSVSNDIAGHYYKL